MKRQQHSFVCFCLVFELFITSELRKKKIDHVPKTRFTACCVTQSGHKVLTCHLPESSAKNMNWRPIKPHSRPSLMPTLSQADSLKSERTLTRTKHEERSWDAGGGGGKGGGLFLRVPADGYNARTHKLGAAGKDAAIATGRIIVKPQLSHQILFIHIFRPFHFQRSSQQKPALLMQSVCLWILLVVWIRSERCLDILNFNGL